MEAKEEEKIRRETVERAKTVVVKVGSSTITHRTGKLNLERMEKLVRQLADLHHEGRRVLLVTSGAVGAGMGKLGLTRRPRTMPEKQACAAVGQGILMHMYEKLFAEYGIVVAQVLLTRDDFSSRPRFLNARHALHTLLQMGVIPIVNENDTVATEEIRLGDNDTLSAMVAALVEADLLLLLSDIEGLYTANPRQDKTAQLIEFVREITPELERSAGGAGSHLGTGGMVTKLQAARIATSSGVAMVIANGSRENVIRAIMRGEKIGTFFLPRETPLQMRKKWLAFGAALQGELVVDEGAEKALVEKGKSLLPSGIVEVRGEFEAGTPVRIVNRQGRELARGIVNYRADEIRKIMGKKTAEIPRVLGYKDYDEVVHRNNMVLSC